MEDLTSHFHFHLCLLYRLNAKKRINELYLVLVITITVDSPLTDIFNNGPLPNNGHCSMQQLKLLYNITLIQQQHPNSGQPPSSGKRTQQLQLHAKNVPTNGWWVGLQRPHPPAYRNSGRYNVVAWRLKGVACEPEVHRLESPNQIQLYTASMAVTSTMYQTIFSCTLASTAMHSILVFTLLGSRFRILNNHSS